MGITKPPTLTRLAEEHATQTRYPLNCAGKEVEVTTFDKSRCEGFLAGARAVLTHEAVVDAIAALKFNKLNWEAVNPDGHMHMTAWQKCRDALSKLDKLMGEVK